jgi:hypothetical protein
VAEVATMAEAVAVMAVIPTLLNLPEIQTIRNFV